MQRAWDINFPVGRHSKLDVSEDNSIYGRDHCAFDLRAKQLEHCPAAE